MRGLLRAVRTATPGRSSVGRRASSNAAEGDATEARARLGRRSARGARVSSRREVPQPFKSTRPARGLSSEFPTEGTFGVHAVRPESKVAPLQSTLTGKTEPVGRRRRAPAPEEEARIDRGVSARANPARSWGAAANAAPVGAALGRGAVLFDCSRKIRPSESKGIIFSTLRLQGRALLTSTQMRHIFFAVPRLSEGGVTIGTKRTYRVNARCSRVGFRSTKVISFTRRGPQLE